MRNLKRPRRALAVSATTLLGLYLLGPFGGAIAKDADLDRSLPAPLVDETPKASGTATLILAGRCFNQQYPDQRTQYRSEIFAANPEQVRIAKAYITQLDQAKMFPKAIVTKVGQDTGFYPAEAYHQNFLTLHPDSPYIATFDLPKIVALRKVFPAKFRPDPVLAAGRSS